MVEIEMGKTSMGSKSQLSPSIGMTTACNYHSIALQSFGIVVTVAIYA